MTAGTIQLCGRLVIEIDGARIEHRLPGRLGRLLFTYLVLNRTRDSAGEELINALWPAEPPPQAGITLRTLLSKLRHGGALRIDSEAGGYRLVLPDELVVDVELAEDAIHRAEAAVAGGEWRRAWAPSQAALFTSRRGFLQKEGALWIESERRVLMEIELRALECYAAACLGVGGVELPAAERSARRLVEREPFRESGHRILMRSLAQQGNVAAALVVYDRLADHLRSGLGVDPGPQTKELHRELLRLAY